MTRYVLTGTTGRLGSRILRSVLEKGLIPPTDLVISSSNPARVPPVARRHGVEIRRGSYTDPASMKSAFSGADVLFLMSHPDPGVQRVQFHKNAIETARAVGVDTVIYSSMMLGGETGLDSVIGIQQGHIHTMRYLAQSGIDHVIVRQGIYAEAWGHYVGFDPRTVRQGDPRPAEWVVPQDIAIAWTALDELGEGNAAVLADYRNHLGQTLRLTGPKATRISEIARVVEARTGRTVNLRFAGRHPFYEGLANGEGEVVDPLLGQLLGRPPKGIEEMPDELFG
ncbi:NAD(P)H-binding protein [Streptomyces sp. NBC_01476]|uniref:NAD(P)H-binding protein n=1 Tax=Streptomyces sp. NBC_01476 TaxID=2903881 RepID=UPI002E339E12|nr:NAD(P)H-binding protein [Streptomyces sp. NBC_01476]